MKGTVQYLMVFRGSTDPRIEPRILRTILRICLLVGLPHQKLTDLMLKGSKVLG